MKAILSTCAALIAMGCGTRVPSGVTLNALSAAKPPPERYEPKDVVEVRLEGIRVERANWKAKPRVSAVTVRNRKDVERLFRAFERSIQPADGYGSDRVDFVMKGGPPIRFSANEVFGKDRGVDVDGAIGQALPHTFPKELGAPTPYPR
ncbi:hypothetical protein EON81_11680 [bacterium]|nr:MAG: hypothetical protein EON81_11680 [bacterium]